MEKKSIFIDMDDVLVIGRFQDFMDDFLQTRFIKRKRTRI